MPANRVEELETRVDELQSTVGGLTDELVEAKERIRVLEAELDTDAPTRVPENRSEEIDVEDDSTETTPIESTPTETAFDDDGTDDEETEDSGASDIIVA